MTTTLQDREYLVARITEAFVNRRISRRSCIRGLAFLGLSGEASAALSEAAAASRSPANVRSSIYSDIYIDSREGAAEINSLEECAEFASSFVGIGTSPELIGYLSGCRIDAESNWFLPVRADDPRLEGGPMLSAQESRQTLELKLVLLQTIDGFMLEMDRITDPTTPSGTAHTRTFRDALDELRGTVKRVEYGYLKDTGDYPNEVALAYWRRLDPFLTDPAHTALAEYALWWGQRRVSAVDTMCLQLAPAWCTSLQNRFLRYPPWPWDLSDAFTMAEYLDWALANGQT